MTAAVPPDASDRPVRATITMIGFVALYLALMVPYHLAVPLGEGPDEAGHVRYAFFLAREGRLPALCVAPCDAEVPGEGHQPPLAYLAMVPAVIWLPVERRVVDWPGNPRFIWAGGTQVNAVAHGSRDLWPWRDQTLAWHLARMVSTAWGIATVIFTFLAARRINPAVAAPAAALVVLNPQVLFMSTLVTNDTAVMALAAMLTWLMCGAATPRAVLGAGVVIGCALITKQSAAMLIPPALLWAAWRVPRRPQAFVRQGAHLAAPMIVIAGWWYLRNLLSVGDLFGLAAFKAEFATQSFDMRSLLAWRGGLWQLFASFWGRFGWMNVAPPWQFSAAYAVGSVVALIGLPLAAARGIAPARALPIALLMVMSLVWIIAFATTAGLVAWQGRLLFPALAAIAIVLGIGLTYVLPEPRGVRLALLGLMIAGAAWMPGQVIAPAYPRLAVSEATALGRPHLTTFARFARYTELGVQLVGWSVRGTPRPDGTVTIELIWQSRSYQNRDWQIFVQLHADERVLVEQMREPGDGTFPMSQWVAGDWVVTEHQLAIPADAAPGHYTLTVGLADPAERIRAALFNDDDVNDPEDDSFDLAVITLIR